jgi:hypothetical protein
MSEMENPIQSDVPAYGRPKVEAQQTNQEEPARLGPIQRLTGVLFSPGETFQDINRKPTWLFPFLLTIIVTLAFSVFFEWRAKPDWDRFFNTMVEKRAGKPLKDLPPEQQDQIHKQIEWQKKFAKTDLSSPLTIAIAVGKFFIFYVFAFLIPTGVFALGMMFIQAQTTFKKILSVVAWSWCATGLVGIVVAIAALMVRDEEGLRDINLADPAGMVPTNLAAFLPSDTSRILSTIAASIDIFTIWYLILLSIGFAVIAGAKKFKTSKTATLVFGVYALWVLVKMGFAAIGFGGS